MSFTPLRVRSHGTLLAGVASPEALVERAAELGYGALALTDRDNLYLAVRFLKAAAAAGLDALPGAELTPRREAAPGRAGAAGPAGPSGAAAAVAPTPAAALLLPVDRRGWANLCALLTARHLDERFDLARAIGERHAGLHVVAESPALAAALLAAGVPAAIPAAEERARPLTHRAGLWLGVRGSQRERARLRERLAEAWRLGVPAVATGDVLLREPADHETHRVAVTVAAGELLERMPPSAFGAREAWLASGAEWERRIRAVCSGAGCGEAADVLLANNAALTRRVRVELGMGVPIFPRAPRDDGGDPAEPGWADARLAALAGAGLAGRYPAAGAARAAARARLAEELSLIGRMGFTDYFLLVAGIVGFARERGIPTVGRGSGAASIVAYLLGVTNVDPVRYGLRFERFLHPQRRDCPDLDVDLCWRRRDEVIAHVYEAYGHDRVAMISTHATLGPRAAFREAAKALGVPLPRVNALARRVPRGELPDPSALERTLQAADAGEFREPRIAEALRLAGRLAGAPRHLSVHCGGLVIADRELTHYLPLERAAKGVVVSQFEMRAVEAIGLVKMDLLGNRALTTIGECIELAGGERGATLRETALRETALRETALRDLVPTRGGVKPVSACGAPEAGRSQEGGGPTGCSEPEQDAQASGPHADTGFAPPSAPPRSCEFADPGVGADSPPATPDAIPDADAITAEVLAAGDTLNCFQLESPAMRHLLRMLDCRSLDGTIAAVALVRPGPAESGMKEAFCRRRRGLEPVAFPHERLRATLAETHGILLYEEDVMRVAHDLAGLPHAEGETLRRAIAAARGDEEFRFLERGFLAQAARAGVAGTDARRVWVELTRFAGYAFCKAHAAGYGRLGWQSVYLKTRFPAAWAVGVLHSHAGMYPTWVHVEDLRRGGLHRPGVRMLAPCVVRSGWESRLEPAGPPSRGSGNGAHGAGARTDLEAAARGGPVRIGLHRVAGLAQASGERLLAARAGRPFASLADLADRARPTPPELEALVLSGACDALPGPAGRAPRTRAAMLLEARVGVALGAARSAAGARARQVPPGSPALGDAAGTPLAPAASAPRPGGEALPELPELPPADLVRGEFASTGLWFSGHPLTLLAPPEARRDATPAAELARHAGRRVAVCGIPCATRRVETRAGAAAGAGGHVLFVTLADASGLAECVLFPSVYVRFGRETRGEVVRIEGRVDDALGALTVIADRVRAFGGGDGATACGRGEASGSRVAEAGPPSRYRQGSPEALRAVAARA